ncbi:MAG: DNA-directed RNA polymerase subunit beta' [Candidatus Poribacteria bacterium]|nr:DNA-directed RNA polymerase subunit beta' [Candidatus Poribacteria bacterium]
MSKNLNNFDAISIRIASPEQIKMWAKPTSCRYRNSASGARTDCFLSSGGNCQCSEIRKPETINYRTFRPERDGLFCEAIFGPQKDWECACGKYKRIKHKGVICDRCGVEVTQQKVRRERMGYIQLAAPVSHIWFFKGLPSRIGLFLDLPFREIERVIYFESFIVLDVSDPDCGLEVKQLLTEEEHNQLQAQYPDSFRAGMGADAIRELLERIDLDQEIEVLRVELEETGSKQKARKLSKRLKLVIGFKKSGNQPLWMILSVIPVIPPDLRPLVALDGGRFATSDLNDLYRRVINRNNRLKRLMELRAPEVIIRNEKRMLQEAVDALLDNGRHGRMVRGPGNRPLKSLSDMLKGKSGRFRQNLLGKRVDYSGRTVIVVGPELQLHQCGLPKKMALELFKPFIIHKLQAKGYAHTIKRAKNMAEQVSPEVWEVLEEVIDEHPVLLNRAPTLHRLGIQAFQPMLVEGKAIRINPLVCEAFNADFDGDQMAVHVPLSVEAQVEAKLLMMATRNLMKPAHGGAIAVPSKDVSLGCSFMTKEIPEALREKVCRVPTARVYQDTQEIILAHECDVLGLHDPVKLYIDGATQPIETTVGRVIFNQVVPDELKFTDAKTRQSLPFINQEMRSGDLSKLVSRAFEELGNRRTVEFIDDLKRLGFHYATKSGISIAMQDMIIPTEKPGLIQAARKQVEQIESDFQEGGVSEGERYNKVIDVWHQLIAQIETALFDGLERGRDDEMKGFNPVHIMVDSGAISRSKRDSIRQLSGLRGLMTKPSGEIIEEPIEACFHEGLSVLEYFISTHGARKGLADTAIKTASSGYLTRKLVDVAQDVMITMVDCGTLDGIIKTAGEEEESSLAERIFGRTAPEDIVDPITGELLVPREGLITHQMAARIEAVGITEVKVRSVLMCAALHGACAKCYGTDLTSGHLVDVGEAIGIIAAQSIGEPGTQLTMRTFHTGGTVSGGGFQSKIEARHDGAVQYVNVRFVVREVPDQAVTEGADQPIVEKIVLSRNGQLRIVDENERVVERHAVTVGSRLCVEDGQFVIKEDAQNGVSPTLLLEWDPYRDPILTEHAGRAVFKDMIEGETMREDKATGLAEWVIIEYKGEDQPRIEIRDDAGEVLASYLMPTGAHLSVTDGMLVEPGTVLARLPRETAKSRDIVTGLPRITELFEARRPKDAAVISEIEGYVKVEGASRGVRIVRVVHEDLEISHRIPQGKHLIVQDEDWVEAGEPLTDGPKNPHDILKVEGEEAVQRYLVDQVQEVYRNQGERINDKHIEVIVRQMLGKVKIGKDPGDTEFLEEDEVDRLIFTRINRRVQQKGERPATAEPILQGITKASLSTESFISAASFQQTTNVLTRAAVVGKRDQLVGLKENVIMGHLIPAGTGVSKFRKLQIFPKTEEQTELPDSSLFPVDEQAAN